MKIIILYQCDPDKNPDCTKTSCGWLKNGPACCFLTSEKKCAARDANGDPIVKDVIKEGVDI